MAESVYKVIELVGTSTESWERAASAAIERASQSLRDLRIAEVSQLDMQLEGGRVLAPGPADRRLQYVDGRDLAVLAGAWNSCPGNPRYAAAANLDRDGICIDLGDFHLFMDAFGALPLRVAAGKLDGIQPGSHSGRPAKLHASLAQAGPGTKRSASATRNNSIHAIMIHSVISSAR